MLVFCHAFLLPQEALRSYLLVSIESSVTRSCGTGTNNYPSNIMSSDPLEFQGIAYVEFYVSNARQAAHFYRTALGLVPIAYSGLETGVRDRASWLLRKGQVHFLLTSPLGPEFAPGGS